MTPHKNRFQREITIIGPENVKRSAMLYCECRDWTARHLRHTECRIQLLCPPFCISAIEPDFFEAFCRIREELERHNFYAFCYGSSKNVFPSAMGRDMGEGLVAYKLTIGEPAEQLVDIFDSGPDIEIATVALQAAFWKEWLKKQTGLTLQEIRGSSGLPTKLTK